MQSEWKQCKRCNKSIYIGNRSSYCKYCKSKTTGGTRVSILRKKKRQEQYKNLDNDEQTII